MRVIRISINAGHTAKGPGYGAEYKGFRKSEINRDVVKALIPKLKKIGHTVHNSTVDSATSSSAYFVTNPIERSVMSPFVLCPRKRSPRRRTRRYSY